MKNIINLTLDNILMKRQFLLFILLLSAVITTAQNPFAKYGFNDVKIATMTNGEYDENHDKEAIVEIGSIRFDVKKKSIVGKVDEKKKYVSPQVVSRFVSIDPLAERHYSISPYVYCKNNPINRIDPDGKDDFKFTSLGQIIRVKGTENNGKTDRLFAANGNHIEVSDKALLPGLLINKGGDYNRRRFYQETSNLEDAVKVFKFSTDNTDREWRVAIYLDGEEKIAVVATNTHKYEVSKTDKYDKAGKKKTVDIHSHPDIRSEKGGSDKDMENANDKIKNAVYHKHDKYLYEYTSKKMCVNSIPIENYQDILDYINDAK